MLPIARGSLLAEEMVVKNLNPSCSCGFAMTLSERLLPSGKSFKFYLVYELATPYGLLKLRLLLISPPLAFEPLTLLFGVCELMSIGRLGFLRMRAGATSLKLSISLFTCFNYSSYKRINHPFSELSLSKSKRYISQLFFFGNVESKDFLSDSLKKLDLFGSESLKICLLGIGTSIGSLLRG